MAEVARQGLPRDLGERAGQLDARRPGADDHERHPGTPPGIVGLALGDLERHQDPLADPQSVFQALQSGRVLGPIVMAEIGMGRARRHDQDVVIDRAVEQHDPFLGHDELPWRRPASPTTFA